MIWLFWVGIGIIVFEAICRALSYYTDKKLREKDENGKETDEDISA